jgi:hypothetical protein
VAPALLSSWWGAPPSFGELQWAFERVIGPETVPPPNLKKVSADEPMQRN